MNDINLYRSKLRSPNRGRPDGDQGQWDHPSVSSSFTTAFSSGMTCHTPSKNMNIGNGAILSPHKSGYFLRTPSPLKKLRSLTTKHENPGTPSPQKAGLSTDLFGNKSLLDNLDVPEDWDDNFLDNFKDEWLFGFGFGNEDLDSLTKSPLKSPTKRSSAFLNNTPKKLTSSLSPFKSPLLTSSPKFYNSSPGDKTPGGRPLTRQRRLFLQSPEHQVPHVSGSNSASLPAPIPFPAINDTSSSSTFNEGALESSSIQSISSYLKNIDEEDQQDELSVMPPAGWTSKGNGHRVGKSSASKSSKSKRGKAFTMLQSNFSGNVKSHPDSTATAAIPPVSTSAHLLMNTSRRMKVEPQFTLLRPYTELHTNQISLRTAPVTPPNKIKISRDFSQIQTLPSKEQLRIVRNRFRDTLNKAVEQTIEREQQRRGVIRQSSTALTFNTINNNNTHQHHTVTTQVLQPQQQPSIQPHQVQLQTQPHIQPQLLQPPPQTPVQISTLLSACGVTQFNMAAAKPPPMKKRRR